MIALGLNIPEVSSCDGIDIAGGCVSWLLVGLVLGTLGLALVRSLRALGQRARLLGGPNSDQQLAGFAGTPPRVSLVRLAPLPAPNAARNPS